MMESGFVGKERCDGEGWGWKEGGKERRKGEKPGTIYGP